MTQCRYVVIRVHRHAKRPQFVRDAGFFANPEDAERWRESEGLPSNPSEGEWGVVIPEPRPEGEAS